MSYDEYSQLPPDDRTSSASPAAGKLPQPEPEEGVEVPWKEIPLETLERLIEAFVLREGTDYGEREATLTRKIADVMRQLEVGEAKVVFDLTTESCSILTMQKHVSRHHQPR